MITGIFGLPGVGKSTVLAMYAKHGFKNYDRVYSNFYISGCYQLEWDKLGIENFHDCLMLIDEISLYCDNRDWKSFSKDLLYFFKMHRHYGIDIIYCSQSYQDCDKKIRDITDEIYQITRFFFGFSRIREISKSFGVNQGRIEEYYEPVGIGKFCYRRKYYHMFDSYDRKDLPPVTALQWDFPYYDFYIIYPFSFDEYDEQYYTFFDTSELYKLLSLPVGIFAFRKEVKYFD